MEFVVRSSIKKKSGVSSVVCPAISSDAACTFIVEANSKQARIPGSIVCHRSRPLRSTFLGCGAGCPSSGFEELGAET
jgi:hypothetical protein